MPEIDLSSVTCGVCGLVFPMPAMRKRKLQQSGDGFECPGGHTLVFGQSENETLRAQVREFRSRIEVLVGQVERLRQGSLRLARRLRAQKAATTRLRRRLADERET